MNGKTYIGPLKWIVCLLGDDVYPINQFTVRNKLALMRSQNLSISMMTLSSEAKKYHSRDYRDLCQKTREGIYVNVLYNDEGVAANAANRESEKIDKIANRFFSTMDVYPSKTKTITIREFFSTF